MLHGSGGLADPSATVVPLVFLNWLRAAVQLRGAEEGSCTRITLDQMSGDRGQATGCVLGHWPVDAKCDPNLDDLAQSIVENARAHASAFPGSLCLYDVVAYYGKQFHPLRRTTLRIMEHDGRPSHLLPYEQATSDGLVGQLMRHVEAKDRLLTMSIGTVFEHHARIISELRARTAELEAREMETTEMYRRLTQEERAREMEDKRLALEQKKADRDAEVKTQLMEKLSLLLPVVANRMAGERVFPDTLSGTEATVKAIVESLTPDQLQKLSQTLTLEQQVAFLDLVKKHVGSGGT